jgi:hypothetical protein
MTERRFLKTMLRRDVLKMFEIEYNESQKRTYDPVNCSRQ